MVLRLYAVAGSMSCDDPTLAMGLWFTLEHPVEIIPHACRYCQGLCRGSAASPGGSKGGTRAEGFFRAFGEPRAPARAQAQKCAKRFLNFSWKAPPSNAKRSD